MKVSAITQQVRDALADWAQTHSGDAEVASDLAHLFAILSAKPGGVRVAVFIPGEDKRGDNEEASVVDLKFTVFVSRGWGFSLEKAAGHYRETAASDTPLFDLVEEAVNVIRGLSLVTDWTESTPNYLGFRVADLPTDRPVDAYQLDFMIGRTLDAPTMTTLVLMHASITDPFTIDDDASLVPKFDLPIYSQGTGYDAGTGIFTAPADGYYHFQMCVHLDGATADDWNVFFLVDNALAAKAVDATSTIRECTSIFKLDAGQTVTPSLENFSGSQRTVLQDSLTFLKIHQLY